MLKFGLLLGLDGSSHFESLIGFLQENNWDTEMYRYQSWMVNQISYLPVGADECDALIVRGMGSRHGFVNALDKLSKPIVYITTFGFPNLNLESGNVVIYRASSYSFKELLDSVERLME